MLGLKSYIITFESDIHESTLKGRINSSQKPRIPLTTGSDLLIRNASVDKKCLYALLARRVFMAPLLRRSCPLVRRGEVISIVNNNAHEKSH